MIQEVPAGEWCPFMEAFGRTHRAWLATIHVVDGGGALTRWTQVRLKSATSEVDAALFEFLEEGQSLCARRPVALRIQQTHTGAVQALEIDTVDGQFIRLAFRATALPEQLDGLAPGELAFAERSPEPTGALAAATLPTAKVVMLESPATSNPIAQAVVATTTASTSSGGAAIVAAGQRESAGEDARKGRAG